MNIQLFKYSVLSSCFVVLVLLCLMDVKADDYNDDND